MTTSSLQDWSFFLALWPVTVPYYIAKKSTSMAYNTSISIILFIFPPLADDFDTKKKNFTESLKSKADDTALVVSSVLAKATLLMWVVISCFAMSLMTYLRLYYLSMPTDVTLVDI